MLGFSTSFAEASSTTSGALGALQVDALLSGIYIRSLDFAVTPLLSSDAGPMTPEEAVHFVELLLESLYDLLQPSLVQAVWFSFDGDWRRPPLLEQVAGKAVELVTKRPPSSERPLPAHLMQLCSAVLTRIVSAFVDAHEGGKPAAEELARLQKQSEAHETAHQGSSESPKKARAAFEKSPLLEAVPLPPGSSCEASEEWVFKLIWLFRTINSVVPYSAVGEFFGQPKEDSEKAVNTFSDSFDWGAADIEKALRSFLEAFLLPKEAQQIDRILRVFAHAYYRKHVTPWETPMAEVAESWEDLCPKKKGRKPKKSDLREHKPVVHQASGQRIRKKKDTDTASPELPPESPPLHVPQVRLPEPTSCATGPQQQLQPTAKEFVPMTPWQTEMCPPYPAYQAFSYQAYTPQAFQYYQDYQAYQAPAVPTMPTMPTVPTVPAPPAVPAWTPPVVSKISQPEKNEKMEKHETTRDHGDGDSDECEDWEELYDSEPGSTEVHSAIPSVHSSPAGPKPEVKPCVAPPWLLCTSNRRRAQQKQA
eukprot:symbB.v1.2.019866.t3/scaffold1647.1/size107771/2